MDNRDCLEKLIEDGEHVKCPFKLVKEKREEE